MFKIQQQNDYKKYYIRIFFARINSDNSSFSLFFLISSHQSDILSLCKIVVSSNSNMSFFTNISHEIK
jgi:hypothetical protein